MKATLRATSTRTFVLWPATAIARNVLLQRPPRRRYLPLVVLGYLQYRLAGSYRTAHGGGGPGMDSPPDRLVITGIYRYTRNPMYIGHLLTLAGLALTTGSPFLGAVFGWHLPWFDERARRDEERLEGLFGDGFRAYEQRVPRWIEWPSPPRP